MTIFYQTDKTKAYLKLGLLIAFLAVTNTSQAELHYNITDLGTWGLHNHFAYGINASGQVTGSAGLTYDSSGNVIFDNDSYYNHAIIINSSGQVIDLGTFGGTNYNSVGYDINAIGQVAGRSEGPLFSAGYYSGHAFVTNTSGEMIDLGTLGGPRSVAYGINDSGLVTGWAETTDGGSHAFITNDNGVMIDMGTLGGNSSTGSAINNQGQVTGFAQLTDGITHHAFITNSNLQMIDLGTLGGSSSAGTAINDLGQVTGYSLTAGDSFLHAFVTDGSGIMIDIGTLDGISFGNDINNFGQVVGSYGQGAFVTVNGKMTDLTSLLIANEAGWQLENAQAINDIGQIVGLGINKYGGSRTYLLTPAAVPIPTAAWLFGSGLIGLLGFKRNV
ncbi:MAG: hypothetical protein PHC94_13395 [Methylobacter sp.]|nr:hypothetical protein [Methylobacter sp.]